MDRSDVRRIVGVATVLPSKAGTRWLPPPLPPSLQTSPYIHGSTACHQCFAMIFTPLHSYHKGPTTPRHRPTNVFGRLKRNVTSGNVTRSGFRTGDLTHTRGRGEVECGSRDSAGTSPSHRRAPQGGGCKTFWCFFLRQTEILRVTCGMCHRYDVGSSHKNVRGWCFMILKFSTNVFSNISL